MSKVKMWNSLSNTEKTVWVIGLLAMLILAIYLFRSVTAPTSYLEPATANGATGTSKPIDITPSVPPEYTSALAQANTYANEMNLSKGNVYDQLTSEYGGQFSKESAQYAVDNVEANWYLNALHQARTYQNEMNLSPTDVYDQLVSEDGGRFTADEAEYAINNLND